MREDSSGIRLTATSHEASSEIVIVIATCERKIEIWFGSPKMLGRNTMQWQMVPAESAIATLRTPRIEALTGSPGCFSRCCWMLSTTTTALSTTMPTAEQQAHHRQDVERQADEVHDAQGDHEAHRHRRRDHQGRGPVAQEEEQHHDRQHGADEAGLGQRLERADHALGLVVEQRRSRSRPAPGPPGCARSRRRRRAPRRPGWRCAPCRCRCPPPA